MLVFCVLYDLVAGCIMESLFGTSRHLVSVFIGDAVPLEERWLTCWHRTIVALDGWRPASPLYKGKPIENPARPVDKRLLTVYRRAKHEAGMHLNVGKTFGGVKRRGSRQPSIVLELLRQSG